MADIRVLVVDDHDLVLMGIKALLSHSGDIKLLDTAKTGAEALVKIRTINPDVIVLDIDLPDMLGIEVARKVIAENPKAKILFHTSFIDEHHIVESFSVGALGYVPKNFNSTDFVDAIRMVNKGEKYMKGIVSEIFIESYFKTREEPAHHKAEDMSLTRRETEILKLVADGLSNQEIADKLFISIRTVEAHKSNIMNKLNIFNTAELVKYALKHGIASI